MVKFFKSMKPMKKIMIVQCIFGFFMGVIFPFYANFFIEWIPGRKIPFIIGCLIAGVLVGLFGFYITKVVLKQIDVNYKDILESKLGLSSDNTDVSDKDIIINMQNEFNQLLDDFASTIKHLSESIYDTTSSIESLTEQLNTQAEETSATNKNLTSSMDNASALTNEINTSLQKIESTINSISIKSTDGVQTSNNIKTKANDLKQSAVTTSENATSVYNNMKQELESAIEQAKVIEKINSLVQTILDMTAQTNLLSLNAAIESSRAGEYGKGFQVIADEIRQLANKSSQTASDIQSMVETVNSSVGNLSNSSEKILEFIDKNIIEDYDKLIKISEQYNQDAEYFNNLMVNFNEASQQLNASINNISAYVKQVDESVNTSVSEVEKLNVQTSSFTKEIDGIKTKILDGIKISEKFKNMFVKKK